MKDNFILKCKDIIENLEDLEEQDEIYVRSNVHWQEYENILEKLGDASWCKVSYLDGFLEIMSPSRKHESIKELTSILFVCYCDEKGIDYFPVGSTTLKNEDLKTGKEPDTSYAIGVNKELPDIAVEVNFTSGNINDLEKYKRLGVPEIWLWDKSEFSIYLLENTIYQKSHKSKFLKNLDASLIQEYVLKMKNENPRVCKKEFIEKIKSI